MSDHMNQAGIEAALDALLQAAIETDEREREHDQARPPAPIHRGNALDPSDFITPQQSAVAALVRSPIGAACRQAVKVLGQALYDLGGQDLMQEVAGRVQDHPTQGGRRISILDHAWNGCGKDGDRWWC